MRPEHGVEEGPERELEDLEALAEIMVQRHQEMERAQTEFAGWEGQKLVTAALSADESGRTLREARRIFEGTASLRRKLDLPSTPDSRG